MEQPLGQDEDNPGIRVSWSKPSEEVKQRLAFFQRIIRDGLVFISLLASLLVLGSFWYQVDNVCVEIINPKNPRESGIIAYRSQSGTALHYVANYKTLNASAQLAQIRIYRWSAPMEHRPMGYLCTDCKKAERDWCRQRGLPAHCNELSLMIETPRFMEKFMRNQLVHRFSMMFEDGQEWLSHGPGYNCPHFFFAVNDFKPLELGNQNKEEI